MQIRKWDSPSQMKAKCNSRRNRRFRNGHGPISTPVCSVYDVAGGTSLCPAGAVPSASAGVDSFEFAAHHPCNASAVQDADEFLPHAEQPFLLEFGEGAAYGFQFQTEI